MGGDPRNDDDAEETPISAESAARAAKTAAALGRAPNPQTTARIGRFDLDKALEKSREDAEKQKPGKSDETPSAPSRDPRSPS